MGDWLKSEEVGMEEYFPLFVSEGIESLEVASFLSEQDLIELGIVKYGHIKTLCLKFKQYREGVEVIDAGCEGAGFHENIALPDFDVDNMPNAADNDHDMKVADIHHHNGYLYDNKQEKDEEKMKDEEQKNGNGSGLMAFDPMILSDVIPPILPKQVSDKSFVEKDQVLDGNLNLDPNSNKSSLSSSIDLID